MRSLSIFQFMVFCVSLLFFTKQHKFQIVLYFLLFAFRIYFFRNFHLTFLKTQIKFRNTVKLNISLASIYIIEETIQTWWLGGCRTLKWKVLHSQDARYFNRSYNQGEILPEEKLKNISEVLIFYSFLIYHRRLHITLNLF